MIAEVLKNNFSPTCYDYYKQNFVFVKGAILKKSEKSMEEKRRRRYSIANSFRREWEMVFANSMVTVKTEWK